MGCPRVDLEFKSLITLFAVCLFAHILAQLPGVDRQFLTYQMLYRQSEIYMQVQVKP